MSCFARLVRVFLGADAIAETKLEYGPGLCLLGVDLVLSARGFKCRPSAEKLARWFPIIEEVIAARKLLPGCASKLAGRLSWACSRMFHRRE